MRPPVSVPPGPIPGSRVVGPITRTDIVRFAGAGGDFNPLHHDPAFAAAAGFPDVIAMGQLQAGLLAGWVSDTFGVEHIREFGVRFVAPVLLGDILTLSGTVTAHTERDGATEAVLELQVSTEKATVVTGHATVVVAAGYTR